MKLGFDDNHLLTLEDASIPETKRYFFERSGGRFSSYDKKIFVYHKRTWKLINLKNLGDGMQICYLQKQQKSDYHLSQSMFARTLAMFAGFDEEKGEKYRFLPFCSKDTQQLQQTLGENFGITAKITKESQGTFVRGLKEDRSEPESDDELLTHLFALVFLYGKFESKKNASLSEGQTIPRQELVAAKAHIPLFSIRNTLEKHFTEKYIPRLQQLGIFITSSLLQNESTSTLQISINDLEVLKLFATWLNHYQNADFSLLTTGEQKQTEIKNQLLDFLKTQEFRKSEGRSEVCEIISTNALKFLR